MALKYGNRIKVQASGTPGTSDFVLGTPVAGYQSISAAISSITIGDTVRYVIEEGSSWEIGTGTYNTTGPKVARTTVIQSSAGGSTLINFTSAATLMVSVAAGDFLPSDGGTVTGTVVLPSTTSIGTVSSTEIGYLSGVTSAIQTQFNAKAPTASPTLTGTIALSGAAAFSSSITEAVYAISGTTPSINPTLGTIQTWTLSADSTPTFSSLFIAGQAITIMIDDGASRSISWPTITWVNNAGVAPSLSATNLTVIALWKVGTTFYGALVGDGL